MSPHRRRSNNDDNHVPHVKERKSRADVYNEVVNTNHCLQSITLRLKDLEGLTTRVVTETEAMRRKREAADDVDTIELIGGDDDDDNKYEEEDEGYKDCVKCIDYYIKCVIQ